MIYFSIILFVLAAITGLSILIKWLTKKDASKAVIYSHGIAAAAGLTLLIIYAVLNPAQFPKISLILFILAAIGGFYMFIRDLQQKASPMFIAFVHALLALSGFIALVLFVLS